MLDWRMSRVYTAPDPDVGSKGGKIRFFPLCGFQKSAELSAGLMPKAGAPGTWIRFVRSSAFFQSPEMQQHAWHFLDRVFWNYAEESRRLTLQRFVPYNDRNILVPDRRSRVCASALLHNEAISDEALSRACPPGSLAKVEAGYVMANLKNFEP